MSKPEEESWEEYIQRMIEKYDESSSFDVGETPEYFTDLPSYLQRSLVSLLHYPESWIREPYATPQWVTTWQQASWMGWATPASLASFYVMTMARTAMRAGWIPQEMPEYTYAGSETAALQTAAQYNLYGTQYGKMQTSLWQARAAYWRAQQQWAPIAEAWGAAKLASFAFPEAAMIRAFGFPFYGAAQQLTSAAAMAPYVREAITVGGQSAIDRIMQSSLFWPGQYGRPGAPFGEALGAELISGLGEWTAAQTILWGLRPGAGLVSTLKSTAFISLTQAGLGLIANPLSTLAVKQMWGLPLSPQERFEMAAQLGVGAGIVGAGVLAGTQWGFIPIISLARTMQWTTAIPYTLSPATVLAYQTATRVPIFGTVTMDTLRAAQVAMMQQRGWNYLRADAGQTTLGSWTPGVETGLTGLRGMPGETPWLRPIVSSEKWGAPQWAEATYEVVGPTRWSLLTRMMGSVVGGQIGFEAMVGLSTAYIAEAARRQGWTPAQELLALNIGVPIAGTAGLFAGSWLGAKAAGLGLGPLLWAYAAERAYGFFGEDPRATAIREARQQANPLVPISPSERYLAGYPEGPAQLPLGIQGLTDIWPGLVSGAYNPVSPAERYGLVPPTSTSALLPPVPIEPGSPYNAAIQSWQYLAYGGNQFSRTQMGLQQAEAFRYSRAETGGMIDLAYWNRQGGISFYGVGTTIAEQQARAYPWYGGRYGAQEYATTYVWQNQGLVPRGWTPQQWQQAAYGYSRQESAMSPYSQMYQPQYQGGLKTLAEAESYQLWLSGASSLWLAQNTFRITGYEGDYGVKLIRGVGTLGSESLANYARSQVWGTNKPGDIALAQTWLDRQFKTGIIDEVTYEHAMINLQSQAAYTARVGYASIPAAGMGYTAYVYDPATNTFGPSTVGWTFGTDASSKSTFWAMVGAGLTDTGITQAYMEHGYSEELAAYLVGKEGAPYRTGAGGPSAKARRLRKLIMLQKEFGEDWEAHWPYQQKQPPFVRMTGIGKPVTMPWGEVVTPPIPPHDQPLLLGSKALREAVWWMQQWILDYMTKYYLEHPLETPPNGWIPPVDGDTDAAYQARKVEIVQTWLPRYKGQIPDWIVEMAREAGIPLTQDQLYRHELWEKYQGEYPEEYYEETEQHYRELRSGIYAHLPELQGMIEDVFSTMLEPGVMRMVDQGLGDKISEFQYRRYGES